MIVSTLLQKLTLKCLHPIHPSTFVKLGNPCVDERRQQFSLLNKVEIWRGLQRKRDFITKFFVRSHGVEQATLQLRITLITHQTLEPHSFAMRERITVLSLYIICGRVGWSCHTYRTPDEH